MISPRPIRITATLTLVTALVGLGVRFAPLGLPIFVIKYGGSTMWALMGYWIASAILSSWRILAVALLTGALETGVEFIRFFHSTGLDAFRHSLPGIILLGSHFSVWDIVAYWIAISVGAIGDNYMRSTKA